MAKRKSVGIPGLGARLRKYRESKGMTAEMMGDSVHERFPDTTISRQVIFNIESGRKTDISVTELVHLARTLDIPPTALLSDYDEPFEHPEEGPFKDMDAIDILNFFSAHRQYPGYIENMSNPVCREELLTLYKGLELDALMTDFTYDLERWEKDQSKALHPATMSRKYGDNKEAAREIILNSGKAIASKMKESVKRAEAIVKELNVQNIGLPDGVEAVLNEEKAIANAIAAQSDYRLEEAGLE